MQREIYFFTNDFKFFECLNFGFLLKIMFFVVFIVIFA